MAEEEEYGQGVPMVINPQMGPIEGRVESIRYRAQLIARNQKLDSGVVASGFIGTVAGFLFALIMVLVIPLLIWGMM
jgi:tetrahydromethanopterin S-methyltransferase subunit F